MKCGDRPQPTNPLPVKKPDTQQTGQANKLQALAISWGGSSNGLDVVYMEQWVKFV